MSDETGGHADKAAPDWERIEVDFRAGLLSLREIASLHPGTNHVAITRRAKREGWTRDLNKKIQAKAQELVTRQAVTPGVTEKAAVSERRIVESAAQQAATVMIAQRSDISRSRTLCMSLLAELEAETGNIAGLEDLGEILRAPDDQGKDRLNDIYRAVISLPERTKTMKALAESLKHLIGLEREAYNIASTPIPVTHSNPDGTPLVADLTKDPVEATRRYLAFLNG